MRDTASKKVDGMGQKVTQEHHRLRLNVYYIGFWGTLQIQTKAGHQTEKDGFDFRISGTKCLPDMICLQLLEKEKKKKFLGSRVEAQW